MKNRINSILLLIAIVWLTSCESDFLDAKPDKALLVPTTVRDYQALLDNAGTIMNRTPYLSEIASDNFVIADNSIQSFSETVRNSYRWDKQIFTSPVVSDWDIPYEQIFYANVVLDGLKNLDSELDTREYDNIKGIALFHRAWALYHAAQLFTEGYNSGTASTVLGLPIRTNSDVSIVSTRSSLQETYDQIISDTEKAISLLNEEQEVPTRPSKVAAFAFMARVYLTMQNYNQARLYAGKTLDANSELLDYNTLNPSLPVPMPSVELLANRHPEILFLSILVPNTYFGNNTFAEPGLYSSYAENDLRKIIFFNGSKQYKGSYTGMRALQFSGLAVDEVYLIRAEANVRTGNMEAALADLNILLSHRWKKGTFEQVSAQNATDLLQTILSERQKELVTRGVRWSDLKRINQDARFAKILFKKIDGNEYILPPGDKRYVFPIPDSEISVSGIEQNER